MLVSRSADPSKIRLESFLVRGARWSEKRVEDGEYVVKPLVRGPPAFVDEFAVDLEAGGGPDGVHDVVVDVTVPDHGEHGAGGLVSAGLVFLAGCGDVGVAGGGFLHGGPNPEDRSGVLLHDGVHRRGEALVLRQG